MSFSVHDETNLADYSCYSWDFIQENLSYRFSNPYLHATVTAVVSSFIGAVWKDGPIQKVSIGGVFGLFLPLSYYTLAELNKSQIKIEPVFSCFISSVSAIGGVITDQCFKQIHPAMRLVAASLVTVALSFNLNDWVYKSFLLPTQQEENPNHPQYKNIQDVKPMRA